MCNHANFTIQNMGTLTFHATQLTLKGNSTLTVDNEGNCIITDTSVEVLGGYAYFTNTGSLTIDDGYFKDQFDGTYITNYGNATLFASAFVANGTEGKIEIFNSGNLQLRG